MLGADRLNFVEEVAMEVAQFGRVSLHYVTAERCPFSGTHSPDFLVQKSNISIFVELASVACGGNQPVTHDFAFERIKFANDYLSIELNTYVLARVGYVDITRRPRPEIPQFLLVAASNSSPQAVGRAVLESLMSNI